FSVHSTSPDTASHRCRWQLKNTAHEHPATGKNDHKAQTLPVEHPASWPIVYVSPNHLPPRSWQFQFHLIHTFPKERYWQSNNCETYQNHHPVAYVTAQIDRQWRSTVFHCRL